MQIRLGTWVAGRKDAPEGTVQWAGGYTDFSKAPFLAYYKDVKITDYSNGVSGASKYIWDDGSDGSYQSIQVITGGSDSANSTSSAAPSSTSSAQSSKTDSKAPESTASSGASKTASATSTAAPSSSDAPASSSAPSSTVSQTDAAPSSTEIAQSGAYKAGFSAVVMGAGLLASLFL